MPESLQHFSTSQSGHSSAIGVVAGVSVYARPVFI